MHGNTNHSKKEQNKYSLHMCLSLHMHYAQKQITSCIYIGWMIHGSLPPETRNVVSLLQNIQNGSSAHPGYHMLLPLGYSTESIQLITHQVGQWSYASTPAIGLCGVDNFTFHLYHTEDSLTLQDICCANFFSDQSSHCCSSCLFTLPLPF